MSGSEGEDEMIRMGDFGPNPDPLVDENDVVDKRYNDYQFEEDTLAIYDSRESTAWIQMDTDHCIRMEGDVGAQLRGEE